MKAAGPAAALFAAAAAAAAAAAPSLRFSAPDAAGTCSTASTCKISEPLRETEGWGEGRGGQVPPHAPDPSPQTRRLLLHP